MPAVTVLKGIPSLPTVYSISQLLKDTWYTTEVSVKMFTKLLVDREIKLVSTQTLATNKSIRIAKRTIVPGFLISFTIQNKK